MTKTIKNKPSTEVELIPPKEAAVLEGLIEGKDPVQAVRDAGYNLNEANAKATAEYLWKKHGSGNNALLESLEQVGVTPARVASKLNALLDAKTPLKGGKTLVMVDDNQAQIKALDMAVKIGGGYAATKTENLNISFEKILVEIDGLDE